MLAQNVDVDIGVDIGVDVDADLEDPEFQHAIFLCNTCPPPEHGRIVETSCRLIKKWKWSGAEERCQACLQEGRQVGSIKRCAICGECFVNWL